MVGRARSVVVSTSFTSSILSGKTHRISFIFLAFITTRKAPPQLFCLRIYGCFFFTRTLWSDCLAVSFAKSNIAGNWVWPFEWKFLAPSRFVRCFVLFFKTIEPFIRNWRDSFFKKQKGRSLERVKIINRFSFSRGICFFFV